MAILYILLGMAVVFLAVAPFIVLTHELGHALTALLLLPRARVTMYVGSYGDPQRSFRLQLGRFEAVFSYQIWRWWKGLCRFAPAEGPPLRHLLITLAGPLSSVVVGFAAAYLAFSWHLHGALKLLLVGMVSYALLYLFMNLWPVPAPIILHDGSTTYNDGWLVRGYWRLHQLPGLLALAQRHLDAQRYLPAARLLEHALGTVGAEQSWHQLLVHCYQQAGNLRRAEEWQTLYLEGYPPTDADWLLLGHLRSQLGRHAESQQAYARALDVNPRNAAAWNNCGYQLLLLERYAPAEAYLDGALVQDPDFAFAYNNRGLARLRLGKSAAALADIKLSLKLDPDNAYAYRNLGLYYLDHQEPGKALLYFDMARHLDPATPDLDRYHALASQAARALDQG